MSCVWRVWSCVGVLLLVVGCKQQPNVAEEEKTIRNLDAQWARTAATHDVDATVAYYTDDAVLLPPKRATGDGQGSASCLVDSAA